MAEVQEFGKRLAISKANKQVVIAVSVASFLSVFCLVSSQALWSQSAYLNKVNSQKEKAKVQLESNFKAAQSLSDTYVKFMETDPNAIGGSLSGDGDKDGDNAKLVLDALPSSYDFPALASSLEKLLTLKSLNISGISGIDDQLNQQSAAATPTPSAIPMAFTFSVTNISYESLQDLIKTLDSSIRPIQIDTMTLSGESTEMRLQVTAHTFYQPPKAVNITTGVVK